MAAINDSWRCWTKWCCLFKLVNTWGLPALNTGLLLTSGVTLTYAHHALRAGHRDALMAWMLATIALGVVFLGFQITEYGHAYHDGLKLTSGIYGSTFYLLTGFPCNNWCDYVNSDTLPYSKRSF